ncbi:hypothetical protein [Arthrobacter sp. 4R501]|uniref:hypothetical protein n=1 Tax=Arthrobacter sp. 4R501 TaxID=2058886 RepID=UPI0011AFEF58|nr:hypothetical protein [Arthrobacter sp. 4R501]
MNTTAISPTLYPATVREAGDMAEAQGMKLSEFLETLGPLPTPPAGYTMSECVDGLWTAPEIEAPVMGMVIIPAWNYRTQRHYIELWTHKGTEAESLVHLSQTGAHKLAAVLAEVAANTTTQKTEK